MDNYTEIWKDIPEYKGFYKVSSFGRVKSLKRNTTRGKIMSFYLDKSPRHKIYKRPMLRLCKNGKSKLFRICRLVAISFISNLENKPEVNHKDCNPENNSVNNLEWTTRKENHKYSTIRNRMASGENHGMAKLTKEQVIEIKRKYKPQIYSANKLAREYGVTMVTIYRIIHNKNWKRLS